MNRRSSDGSYERLMRKAIANGMGGNPTGRGNTASSGNALSFMGWANAQIDREGEDAHSPPTGRSRRMGMGMKNEGKATLPRDPSPAHGRPVLRLVSSKGGRALLRSERLPPLFARPSLVLVKG